MSVIQGLYEKEIQKANELAASCKLLNEWDTMQRDVTLTIRPDIDDQTSFFGDERDDTDFQDALIRFIFRDGDLFIETDGKLELSDSVINKFKGIAKRMHYLFLQLYREEHINA